MFTNNNTKRKSYGHKIGLWELRSFYLLKGNKLYPQKYKDINMQFCLSNLELLTASLNCHKLLKKEKRRKVYISVVSHEASPKMQFQVSELSPSLYSLRKVQLQVNVRTFSFFLPCSLLVWLFSTKEIRFQCQGNLSGEWNTKSHTFPTRTKWKIPIAVTEKRHYKIP